MKKFILLILCISLTTLTYSQSAVDNGTSNKSLKMEELPEVVIKNAGKDFSVYLPDKTGDATVKQLQQEFISYNLGKDYEGYDNYLVILESKGGNGMLTATYDQNGKLSSVVERYKSVKLPTEVVYSIYKNYPGWMMVDDKYLYSQNDGKIKNKEYTVKIKKDKVTKKVLIQSNGDIVSN